MGFGYVSHRGKKRFAQMIWKDVHFIDKLRLQGMFHTGSRNCPLALIWQIKCRWRSKWIIQMMFGNTAVGIGKTIGYSWLPMVAPSAARTSLLQHAIGGKGFMIMLACLAPADVYYEERFCLGAILFASSGPHKICLHARFGDFVTKGSVSYLSFPGFVHFSFWGVDCAFGT